MKKINDIIIHNGIPFLAAFGFYYFDAPWYIAVLVFLSAVYWYGPVLVYLKQRMPTVSSLRPLDSEAALPTAHQSFFDGAVPLLQDVGFVHSGTCVNGGEKQATSGSVSLLQHQDTSDLAHLLIATKEGFTSAAETVAFSRMRNNGSRIWTSRHTIQSPYPPNPSDSVLKLDGSVDLMDLWHVHQARVSADHSAIRNVTVTNAFHIQTEMEKEGVQKHLASGLWQKDEQPGFLRPTPKGAVLMCLRMLPPWKQISRIRARLEMRRYLRAYRNSTA
jgi:hypothetical protein